MRGLVLPKGRKRLLLVIPVVVALTLVSLFMPVRRVSIEGIGKLSFETTVTLSVGSEVAYASPDVTFVLAGALAAQANVSTLYVVAPACAANDILIAVLLVKDNRVVTAPSGWTKFVEANNTTAQRITIAWKRAVAGDSGATFAFSTPGTANNLFAGVISAWRGCITTATPIDATSPSVSANASSDTVSYATFDPTQTTAYVVAIGVYNNDLTTAGAIAGTNPTFVNRWDLETSIGTDGSIFGYSGDSNGSATGTRTHSTTSTADDINIGVLFGLVAAAEPSITVDPITYNFGVVAESSTPSTITTYFTITNASTIQTDQTISVTTNTWSGGVTWTHSDTATPGVNTAGLLANKGGTWGTGDVIIKYNATWNYIAENQAANTNYSFGLKLIAPTSFTDGVQKQIIVRITAVAG